MHRIALSAGCIALLALAGSARAQESKPYQVEWVYRIQYGHQTEWWKVFQKYQIAILDHEKQLGYVTTYIVDRPGLHTSEDSRWDYIASSSPIRTTPPPRTNGRCSASFFLTRRRWSARSRGDGN